MSAYIAFELWNTATPELVLCLYAAMLSGFILLMFAVLDEQQKLRKKDYAQKDRIKHFATGLLLALLLLFVMGAGPTLMRVTFRQLGLRKEHVSIELPAKELARLQRISQAFGFPVQDCGPASEAKVLVRDVDLLWHGIGSKSWARFKSPDGLNDILLDFDSGDLRMSESDKPLPSCYRYEASQLVVKEALSVDGKRRLEIFEKLLQQANKRSAIKAIQIVNLPSANGKQVPNLQEIVATELREALKIDTTRMSTTLGESTSGQASAIEIHVTF